MIPVITDKKVTDLCGTVSYRRGKSYVQSGKVSIAILDSGRCEAIVHGNEPFQVKIEFTAGNEMKTSCSCPSLGTSYKYECQHVAAVLLAIAQQEGNGAKLADELITLFKEPAAPPSKHQRHFERRQVKSLQFILKPNVTSQGPLLGVEIWFGDHKVEPIGRFLRQLDRGLPSELYDPHIHCFLAETDAVLQQLIAIQIDQHEDITIPDSLLVLPPYAWDALLPLLDKTEVHVETAEDRYPFQRKEGTLPIRFHFGQSKTNAHLLKIDGMDEVVILEAYRTVVQRGNIFRLAPEDCKRLADLERMLKTAQARHIAIPDEQVGFFLEKVVPGLRSIGHVEIDASITSRLVQSPLVAKLYIDRLNNRLLAGLEFQYGHIVINPVADRELPKKATVLRDIEKEEVILRHMEESQFAETDEGYFLHNEELEYAFLYHILPKLQQHVRVYATTAIRNRIFKGHPQPRIRVKAFEDRTNWLEFKFEMDGIADRDIRSLLAALEEKRKYYRLRDGTLLSLETKEFERLQQMMNELPESLEDLEKGLTVPFVRGIRLLHSGEEAEAFSVEESARAFLDKLKNPEESIVVPELLDSVLRPYQKQGYRWMKTLAAFGAGGILADDMGLGKTVQSIAFILSEQAAIRRRKQPVLIVCPSSLTYNWKQEVEKFAPALKAVIVDGDRKKRMKLWQLDEEADVIITSYPLVRRDIQWIEKLTFHAIFLDEAQAIKNPITMTARSVKRIRATHRFALTGTPVENALEELWSIFHVILPELFGGLREFSELQRKDVARRIRPFLLRRMKRDVVQELPEKIETIDSAELLPEQKKLYAAYLAKLRHDTLKHLDKDTLRKNKIRILAGLTRLRQICCHPALFVDGYKGSSAKFEQLKRIIQESQLAGRRVLIFSQFTKMLDLIGRDLAFQGVPFFYLDGQTPAEERLELCQRFNAGERDLFLISLKAGGTGLNLTGADTVILYDLWWNPAVEEQAADRAHRIGQEQVVQVIKLVARGTIEDKMNELQEKKRNLIEEIIDSQGNSVMSLTEEDIVELLT
ncbi:helicase SNF [Sporosarcina sp. NCCP-2222]|uniref:DEAD/DEAH box helicase n=1 Tax=Sporosarcina sp. NCCP-2222 TaxID=2935073 RepID=UPI002084E5FC|nr:DEAD/DEAH box helicase [Sporosarcina sp. NCCP-2222]GKV55316.1 helicase SNF [Sporosarcina sp. NCCP-2222]